MKPGSTPVDKALLVAVVAIACLLAGTLYAGYLARPGDLWRGVYHDRNGHYGFGLDLALSLRGLDPIGFFTNLEKAKVWPPFHGLLLSAVLAVGGPDHRLAVLPSLLGWTVTLVSTWLIARRLFADPLLSVTAATTATAFAALSPAFRLISADVMLEGVGTGLSALAILGFMRAEADPAAAGRWRLLAIVLTLLFFHKGNYWGLVATSLALAWLTLDRTRWRAVIGLGRSLLRQLEWPRLARDPLFLAALVVAGIVLAILARGPTSLEIFGRRLSLYPPNNLTTAAYALLFVRLALLWKRHRAAFDATLGVAGRSIFYWHVLPVAVSFLIPQRLGTFLWFIGPSNAGTAAAFDPIGAAQLYAFAFLHGFSPAPWAGLLALALFVVALIFARRLPPEGRVVLIFPLVCLAAVLIHPQHQPRFLTTFLFAVWVGAGAGLAFVLDMLPVAPRLRQAAAVAVVGALAVGLAVQRPSAEAAALVAIHPLAGPSDLDMTTAYAPFMDGSRRVGIAATFGGSRLLDWPLAERCRCKLDLDVFSIPSGDRDAVRNAAAHWLASTRAERIVVADMPNFTEAVPALGFDYGRTSGIVDAVAAQDRFSPVITIELPDFGGRVLVLKRR